MCERVSEILEEFILLNKKVNEEKLRAKLERDFTRDAARRTG